jgi:hypothetical protein
MVISARMFRNRSGPEPIGLEVTFTLTARMCARLAPAVTSPRLTAPGTEASAGSEFMKAAATALFHGLETFVASISIAEE